MIGRARVDAHADLQAVLGPRCHQCIVFSIDGVDRLSPRSTATPTCPWRHLYADSDRRSQGVQTFSGTSSSRMVNSVSRPKPQDPLHSLVQPRALCGRITVRPDDRPDRPVTLGRALRCGQPGRESQIVGSFRYSSLIAVSPGGTFSSALSPVYDFRNPVVDAFGGEDWWGR